MNFYSFIYFFIVCNGKRNESIKDRERKRDAHLCRNYAGWEKDVEISNFCSFIFTKSSAAEFGPLQLLVIMHRNVCKW